MYLSLQTTPRSQSIQDQMRRTIRATPPPLLQNKAKRSPFAAPLNKVTLDQLSTRAPNFQSSFPFHHILEQLFGTTLSKTFPKTSTKISLKNLPIKKLQTDSGSDSPASELKTTVSEPKILLNLESLVYIETIFESISEMAKRSALEPAFMKCTEWWDETAKVQDCLLAFYSGREKDRAGYENARAHKLELLTVATLQYVSLLCKLNLAEVDGVEFSCATAALTETWQNYLIFLRDIYLQTHDSRSTENKWINEIKMLVKMKLIRDYKNNIQTIQLLHNQAIINLLKQICTKHAKSTFFSTIAMCLKYLDKITYIIIRKMVGKAFYIAVNQARELAARTMHQPVKDEILLPHLSVDHKSGKRGYTLVLDLDETLIHAIEEPNNLEECVVQVRPGAKEFIEEMAKYYELVIFTAGTKDYADYALKFVDPSGIIVHRLYREHAIQKGMVYIKDISRLGRDLKKTIIIDNIAENFQLQSDNGIFINSWEGDERDTSLKELMPILKQIVDLRVPDVRVALRRYRDYQVRNIFSKVIND